MGDRDRSPRRDRRSGGGGSNNGKLRKGPADRRVFINNLPFEAKWQDVKDLFRKEVGEVSFVELFEDEAGRPRGAGIMEFASKDLADKAREKMDKYEFKGRKIGVKEDADVERDRCGRIVTERDRNRGGGRDNGGGGPGRDSSRVGPVNYGNTYGLSTRFLESLGIDCPLHTRVFVANLPYDVDEKKLKEVFRLAGKVVGLELTRDRDGKSRGFAVVVYEHPVEAVQAISMFHNQELCDRRMMVRFDKVPEEEPPRSLHRLPEGLRGIGMGLGQDGEPLWDVKNSLPSASNENNSLGLSNMAMGGGGGGGSMNQAAVLQSALTTILEMAGNNSAGGIGGGGRGMTDIGAEMSMRSNMSREMDRMMDNMKSDRLDRGMGGMDRSMGGMNDGMGGMGGMDRGMGGMDSGMDRGGMMDMDRGMLGMDRGMGAMDRGMSGMDRGMSGIDRGMSGMDRGMSSMDRGMSGMDRGMSGMDRGMSGMDRGMSGMDRGMSGMDRGMSSMDRGMSGMDRSSGGMRGGGSGGGLSRSDRIVVKNIPENMTWQMLKDKFKPIGDIKFAELKERGVGIVRFGSSRDAEKAVANVHGQNWGGTRIHVSLL